MKLSELPILFVDCQTTGANPQTGNLLEISWCVATANERTFPSQSYLVSQPEEKSIPYRIQAITGIKTEDLSEAIAASDIRERLQHTITMSEPAFVIAHFARFEKPFLRELFQTPMETPLPFELFCTFEIAKRMYPNLPSKGIRAVAGFFGTTCGELKRAESHIEATLAIWQGLTPLLEALHICNAADLANWLVAAPAPKRTKFEYPLAREKRLQLPDQPGIYRMLSRNNNVLYVGKATSLKQRVNSYFRGQTGKESKTKELLSQVYDLDVTVCRTPLEAALLETDEIKRLDPPYNRALKRRQRTLLFYSRDFASMSETQDDKHPIGPFSSSRVIEPILKLDISLKQNLFDQNIFFYEIPQVILAEGFELFCINEGIERETLVNSRSLLSLGLWLYRKEQRRRREEAAAEKLAAEKLAAEKAAAEKAPEEEATAEAAADNANLDSAGIITGEKVGNEKQDDEHAADKEKKTIDAPLSAEQVSGKYARMLRHIARTYVRSKLMTRVLHSEVNLVHKHQPSRIVFVKGQMETERINEQLDLDGDEQSELPWHGLDLETYDRMSVLLGELARNEDMIVNLAKQKVPR